MALPPGPSQPAMIQTARWMAKPVQFMEACRRRYGDAFTLRFVPSRKIVFLSHPEAIKAVLRTDRQHRMPVGRRQAVEPILGSRSVFMLEGDQHLERRRLMLPHFHKRSVAAHEGLIEEVTARDMEGWPVGRPFSLWPRMSAISLEIILRAVFGVEEDARRAELRRLLPRIFERSVRARAIGLGRGLLGLPPPSPATRRVLDRVDAILADEIRLRRGDPRLSERPDVLSQLAAARFDDGEAMSAAELRDQLISLLLAGHRTTATGLSWCFDLLFFKPEAARRAKEEVQAGEGAYLEGVIKEALRIRPVIPAIDRELSTPVEVNGLLLPEGTAVVLAIYLLHTRPDLFEQPYEFRPERYLNGKPDTYSWLPFGGGARRCLGANFAEFQMKVVLRTVLRAAELKPAQSAAEPMIRTDVQLTPKHGTRAVLERRL